jgi:hypothetical protein
MEKKDRDFIQKCLDEENTDTHLLIKDDGRFYEEGCDTPFSGVRKIFFSKRFWEKEKKLKSIEYFESGNLIRYIGYYRNGNVAIDHTMGQYPTRFHRNGTIDKRPEVNHR